MKIFFLSSTFIGGRRMSERDMTRIGADTKPSPAARPQLLNSKSVPALHHIGKSPLHNTTLGRI